MREAYPQQWKDSSVAVFLKRMEEKELIKKEVIDGTKYWVAITKREYHKNMLNAILMKLEQKTYDEILLEPIEDPRKRQEALDEIEAIIKKYEDAESTRASCNEE